MKSDVGSVSLPAASTAGVPAWACPSLNVTGPTLHWMGVPVGQPLASSTVAWNANESPSLSSLPDGRTSRRAGSPGVLQSAFGAAAAAVVVGVGAGVGAVVPVSAEGGVAAAESVAAAEAVAAGAAEAEAAAATTLDTVAPRCTSAMQRASLIVNSYRPVSAIETALSPATTK